LSTAYSPSSLGRRGRGMRQIKFRKEQDIRYGLFLVKKILNLNIVNIPAHED
jgi:hypothetical protein